MFCVCLKSNRHIIILELNKQQSNPDNKLHVWIASFLAMTHTRLKSDSNYFVTKL